MEYLFIYLLDLPDKIEGFFFASVLIFIIMSACMPMVLWIDCNIDEKVVEQIKKVWFFILGIFLFFVLVFTIFPRKETLYLLAGTFLGKQIVNSETVSTKIDKVSQIIDLELDKYLVKIKEEE